MGFSEPARHVAQAIRTFASKEGFVFGLEGEWGTGKTSFLNLIADALRSSNDAPEIMNFSPWLISSRDALLGELFREIAEASARISLVDDQPDCGSSIKLVDKSRILFNRARGRYRVDHHEHLKSLLASFCERLTQVSKIAALAELAGAPWAGLIGRGAASTKSIINSSIRQPSLEADKEKLKGELRKLQRKIVIFVDDLDRLEPAEVGEVVRLVRAVADFPNIVYVLSYSRPVLSRSLSEAFRIPHGGEDYLKKIVQVTFSVPPPEDFDLRRMFRQLLEQIFPSLLDRDNDVEGNLRNQRLANVIDVEGGRSLKTPRDVFKTINSLLLYAKPIFENVDIADVVWLQLIRSRDSELYEWIRGYVFNMAAVADGAQVREAEAKRELATLLRILAKDGSDPTARLYDLQRVLPGIKPKSMLEQEDVEKWSLFEGLDTSLFAPYVAGRRLGSPQHFRFYFSLSKPAAAIEDEEFETFVSKAQTDAMDAVGYLQARAEARRPQGGVYAEAILDRLAGANVDRIPVTAIRGIALSFANALDRAAINTGQGDWGNYWVWISADRIFKNLFNKIPDEDRAATIKEIFSSGEAIGWLTNILRRETFAHGKYGSDPKPKDEWIFREDEFEIIVDIMRERFSTFSPSDLMEVPDFLSVLFGWHQIGAEKEVVRWLSEAMEPDERFLAILERMRSWSAVNDRIIFPLRRRNLEAFFDVGGVEERLTALTGHADEEVRRRASALLDALKLDARYRA